MGKILIKNKKSHKPSNNTDTKKLTDQPANQSNEPVSPSNNTGGNTQQQTGPYSEIHAKRVELEGTY